MITIIGDKVVYVVDLTTMPKLPITGNGWERVYADALTEAIIRKLITKPGKYAIHVDHMTEHYDVYEVIE